MTRVAAIDLGSNSTRLLVADVEGARGAAALTVVDRRMRITRLGQGVDATRRLHPDAIARNLAVLREYKEIISGFAVERTNAAATSAARDATNRDDFFGPVSEILGVAPELLSGEEEAALSFLGATRDIAEPAPFLVVDVGGGSTELVIGTDAPEACASIDVGCVRLTEALLHSDPPTAEELSAAVILVRDLLNDVARDLPGATSARTLVGLAGTVTTMATIEQGLLSYSRDAVHHFRLTRAASEDIFRTLALESTDQRRHNPGLEPERADVIVGGVIVVVGVMRHFGFAEMLVSESDILDGLALTAI